MKEWKIVQRDVKEVTGVKCDKCRKSMKNLQVQCGGYGQITMGFGYGSKFDGEVYEGELCDLCAQDLIESLHLRKKKFLYDYELLFIMKEKGIPKRDGSGGGVRSNEGRGGCEDTEPVGRGRSRPGRGRGFRRNRW